eukprot:snap_masked-scaffold_20-processed-gene-1.7-mRNA-1 protein AED:1.00 eAED:1.00 QI:0/-1/0/0/-1/1/1/0/779
MAALECPDNLAEPNCLECANDYARTTLLSDCDLCPSENTLSLLVFLIIIYSISLLLGLSSLSHTNTQSISFSLSKQSLSTSALRQSLLFGVLKTVLFHFTLISLLLEVSFPISIHFGDVLKVVEALSLSGLSFSDCIMSLFSINDSKLLTKTSFVAALPISLMLLGFFISLIIYFKERKNVFQERLGFIEVWGRFASLAVCFLWLFQSIFLRVAFSHFSCEGGYTTGDALVECAGEEHGFYGNILGMLVIFGVYVVFFLMLCIHLANLIYKNSSMQRKSLFHGFSSIWKRFSGSDEYSESNKSKAYFSGFELSRVLSAYGVLFASLEQKFSWFSPFESIFLLILTATVVLLRENPLLAGDIDIIEAEQGKKQLLGAIVLIILYSSIVLRIDPFISRELTKVKRLSVVSTLLTYVFAAFIGTGLQNKVLGTLTVLVNVVFVLNAFYLGLNIFSVENESRVAYLLQKPLMFLQCSTREEFGEKKLYMYLKSTKKPQHYLTDVKENTYHHGSAFHGTSQTAYTNYFAQTGPGHTTDQHGNSSGSESVADDANPETNFTSASNAVMLEQNLKNLLPEYANKDSAEMQPGSEESVLNPGSKKTGSEDVVSLAGTEVTTFTQAGPVLGAGELIQGDAVEIVNLKKNAYFNGKIATFHQYMEAEPGRPPKIEVRLDDGTVLRLKHRNIRALQEKMIPPKEQEAPEESTVDIDDTKSVVSSYSTASGLEVTFQIGDRIRVKKRTKGKIAEFSDKEGVIVEVHDNGKCDVELEGSLTLRLRSRHLRKI